MRNDSCEDEEKGAPPQERSISILRGSTGVILICTDEKFTGRNLCTACRYYPCRINEYFPGAIEDCKLRDQTDPNQLGEINDYRDWGDHLEQIVDQLNGEPRPTLHPFPNIAPAIAAGLTQEAITFLVQQLHSHETLAWPAVWIQLSTCLRACGEERLARLYLGAANQFPKLLPETATEEREILRDFQNQSFAPALQQDRILCSHLAEAHERYDFPVLAFDFHVTEDKGWLGASTWAELANNHRSLGELLLAALANKQARLLSLTPSDASRYEQAARELDEMLVYCQGPALDLERRAAERQLELESRRPELARRRAKDPQVDLLYWLRKLFLRSPQELALATLARLHPSKDHGLLAIPAEVHNKISYKLMNLAIDTLLQAEPERTRSEVRKLPSLDVIEAGLMETGLEFCAAALLCVRHDQFLYSHCASSERHHAHAELAQLKLLVAMALEECPPQLQPSWVQRRGLTQDALDLLEEIKSKEKQLYDDLFDLRADLAAWLVKLESESRSPHQ